MRRLLSKLCSKDELVCVSLALLTAVAVGTAIESLWWRPMHDSPIMLYIGFLMDHGRLPYRDIFDMNMPGADLIYLWIYKLTNGNHIALRVVDLAFLASITGCGWAVMRRFGRDAAWAAAVVFPVIYLSLGPTASLQRETAVLLFLTPILLVLNKASEREIPIWQWVLMGLLAGAAVSVKPQAALVAVGMFAWAVWAQRKADVSNSRVASGLCLCVFCSALPLAASLAWISYIGAWDAFLDISRNYWPLYNGLSGQGEPIQGYERAIWDLKGASWFGYEPIVVGVGLVGAYLAFKLRVSPQSRLTRLMVVGMVCGVAYLVAGGKFWTYHWMPLFYFASALAVLAFAEQAGARVAGRWAIVLVCAALIAQGAIPAVTGRNRQTIAEKTGRVQEMTAFLQSNLRPGDTVQPLDWTGGAVAAILESKAMCGTRFIYDFYFYHDVSHPYIQALRGEFLRDLEQSKPRFVLEVVSLDKPWTHGPDTTRRFPELEAYIRDHYVAVVRNPLKGYIIHERR